MKIYCLGDSNTYGFDPRSYFDEITPWPSILASISGYEVINDGVNGRCIPTSIYSIRYIDACIEQEQPDLIVVMLGSNDILQNASAQVVYQRMKEYMDHLSLLHIPILVLIPKAFDTHDRIYDASSKALISYYKNFDSLDCNEMGLSLLFDGVHLDEKSHEIIAQNLYHKIQNINDK